MSSADCVNTERELQSIIDNFICNISTAYLRKDWSLVKISCETMRDEIEDWIDDAKILSRTKEDAPCEVGLRSIGDRFMRRVCNAYKAQDWNRILNAYEIMQLERQCDDFRRFCGYPNLEDLFPNKNWVCNP